MILKLVFVSWAIALVSYFFCSRAWFHTFFNWSSSWSWFCAYVFLKTFFFYLFPTLYFLLITLLLYAKKWITEIVSVFKLLSLLLLKVIEYVDRKCLLIFTKLSEQCNDKEDVRACMDNSYQKITNYIVLQHFYFQF